MDYPLIKTTEDLRSFMGSVGGEAVTDDRLVWFVCMYNAELISQAYTTKDIAAMLLEGVKATNSLTDVQEFLNTFFEDTGDGNYAKLQNLHIVKHVLDFFGKYNAAEEVQEMINEME